MTQDNTATAPSTPSTKTLDHIVHLSPPGSLDTTSAQFRDLGFTVVPGGVHKDGLTANVLVLLTDGVYLELISFLYPIDHYPVGSPERQARENHNWAKRTPGWIDYAFLGNTTNPTPISQVINDRAANDGSGVTYQAESEGGRARPDGVNLRWLVTFPNTDLSETLPFFCGDITPRPLRVPLGPTNTHHPSTAQSINLIRLLTRSSNFNQLVRQFTTVVGKEPFQQSNSEAIWEIDAPNEDRTRENPRLALNVASGAVEEGFVDSHASGAGIYEVAFAISSGRERSGTTPYGKISWVLERRRHGH